MKNRVYIKNLNFKASEADLEDYLKEYDPITVIVPSHTVRFTKKQEHFGIAYAEFKEPETVNRLVEDLNGKDFMGRALSIKVSGGSGASGSDSKEHSARRTPDSPRLQKSPPPKSEDTLYIHWVHHGVTEEEVRKYFENYQPSAIRFQRYKRRGTSRFSIRHSALSVFVTVKVPEGGLAAVIADLNGKKLRDKSVVLKPAFSEKLNQIIEAEEKAVGGEEKASVAVEEALKSVSISNEKEEKANWAEVEEVKQEGSEDTLAVEVLDSPNTVTNEQAASVDSLKSEAVAA